MMGWRSIRRDLEEPELLKAQFEAIKRVHGAGFKNVGIMIPLVTHIDQVKKAKEILREVGLEPQKDIEFGIMVERSERLRIDSAAMIYPKITVVVGLSVFSLSFRVHGVVRQSCWIF